MLYNDRHDGLFFPSLAYTKNMLSLPGADYCSGSGVRWRHHCAGYFLVLHLRLAGFGRCYAETWIWSTGRFAYGGNGNYFAVDPKSDGKHSNINVV